MIDTTYALMHGKINSVNDIIDAVEQEQEHDERFHSCRVLIREVKRLRKGLQDIRIDALLMMANEVDAWPIVLQAERVLQVERGEEE
tara:strand:- start:26 stop:286 length:261 start_codon:yes stop_codon:yes gene_type:complete